jgi:hypothetical protein
MLFMLMAIAVISASAQSRQVSYFMNIPQNHIANPAFRPSNSVYVGLPGMSGVSLSINNNFLKFSNIFINAQSSDSVFTFLHPGFNVDKFLSKIHDKNSIEPQFSFPVLSVGFAAGRDGYYFFDIIDHIDGNLVIPGDLFKVALKGNEAFAGSKIDLSSFRGEMKYYREAGIGFSRNITPRLRMGVKGKLLFGMGAAYIRNNSLAITVNDDYSHVIDADLSLNLSAPVTVTKEANGDIKNIEFDNSVFDTQAKAVKYMTNTGNFGLGIDIGATYDISERIQVSAAVTDLGYIRWKRDVTNLKASNHFVFNGLDLSKVIDGSKTLDVVGTEMVDSLKHAFKVSDSYDPFTTNLPVGFTAGGSYKLTRSVSLGLMSYTRFIGKQVKEALTLSANANFGSSFSGSLSYTAMNHSYDNVGAGLAFRAGIFQFFMLTDMIPFAWNKIISDNNSIPVPASFNTINLRFGMNLVFGNKMNEDHDKPIVTLE